MLLFAAAGSGAVSRGARCAWNARARTALRNRAVTQRSEATPCVGHNRAGLFDSSVRALKEQCTCHTSLSTKEELAFQEEVR